MLFMHKALQGPRPTTRIRFSNGKSATENADAETPKKQLFFADLRIVSFLNVIVTMSTV